jgi:hypothetical protein
VNQDIDPIQEVAGRSPADRTGDTEAHHTLGRRIAEEEELHIVLGEDRHIDLEELRTGVEGDPHNHHHMEVGVEEHHIRLAESALSWKPRSWGSDHSQTKTGLVAQESSRGSLQLDYHLYPPSSQDREF